MTWTISLADVINWIITICIAGVIFMLYRNRRVQIARITILRELEEDIMSLFRQKIAKECTENPESSDELSLRHVLDNDPSWKFIEDGEGRESGGWSWAKSFTLDGKRLWLIREYTEDNTTRKSQYLSSEAFQEILIWFRRILRAYEMKVVRESDLVDLWRFILPFGFSGRLEYFRRYFQGKEDIQAMIKVINTVIKRCCKDDYRTPIHYFLDYVTDEEREILAQLPKYSKLHKKIMKYSS